MEWSPVPSGSMGTAAALARPQAVQMAARKSRQRSAETRNCGLTGVAKAGAVAAKHGARPGAEKGGTAVGKSGAGANMGAVGLAWGAPG